ncbi:CaiB/BaiF CoA-transferase family protein [Hydrogenophaga sp.]|uniref:CaiB/BaiF CoA transferase family protein n=1 Tax=Hydrogenophaga sp. TaxID=1904254 RepID=UPI002716880B|nr:CoA transferase [Hydrogenophaga sp.]MDO9437597.1 CoA transferase [Hydrogenophaga sp.]
MSTPNHNPEKKMPLSGIRVLDLSRILAAPTAAQMLGDFGADVIKIERPGVGDDARRLGGKPLKDPSTGAVLPMGPMFLCANRNKRSVTLDIAQPAGQAIVRQLVAVSDVLVENYKTGDLERYGLDYASLREINPRLVYCSVTGFGQTGPYAGRVGFDPAFQAMSGLLNATGLPDGVPGGGPVRVGVPITDYIGGIYAYGAILTALYHREQVSGEGQHIDLSLLDCALSAMSSAGANYLATGTLVGRTGQESATSVPSRFFDCADGKVHISAPNDAIFVRLCEELGQSALASDPRFATAALRVTHRDVLNALLEPVFRGRQRAELTEALDRAKVPVAPLYDLADAYADPQVRHRGAAVDMHHPAVGDFRIGTNPIKFSASPITGYTAPPMLGEHTDEVLSGLLGLDRAQILALRANGIV